MIGDYLGKYICYNRSYEIHGRMEGARVLVSLDTRLGFLEESIFSWLDLFIPSLWTMRVFLFLVMYWIIWWNSVHIPLE